MRWLPVTLLNVITVAVLLSQTPARLMAEPDGASRLHWLANGETFAATVLGDHLYVGGTFTRIAPRSAALGSAYMLSTTTGAALPGLPLVDGEVLAVEPDGSGGYYLGGSFRRVGGIVRHGLAHVLADGSVSPSFAPVLETFGPTAIRSIARGPSAVYVLGSFHVVNGTPRLLAAALDPNTAALKSWTLATPAGQLFFDPDRTFFRLGQLFITGRAEGNFVVATADQTTGVFDRQITIDTFLDLNRPSAFVGTRLVTTTRTGTTSQTRPSLVALDLVTGALDTSWSAFAATPSQPGNESTITALATDGNAVYVGGTFDHFGAENRANLAAIDVATGTVSSWAPDTDAPVTALGVTSTGILAAGAFTRVGGVPREHFAMVGPSGATTAWTTPVTSRSIRVLAAAADRVVVGGLMAINGGVPRHHLAAFDLSSDTLLPWAPNPLANVVALESLPGRVFAGTEFCAQRCGADASYDVAAYDSFSAERLPWEVPPPRPPHLRSGALLAGAYGNHVFVNRNGLERVDATTGALDPAWPRLPNSSEFVMHEGLGFFNFDGQVIRAVDLATGTLSPVTYRFASSGLSEPIYPYVSGLAVEGGTVYVSAGTGTLAFDRRSGRPSFGYYGPGGPVLAIGGDIVRPNGTVWTANGERVPWITELAVVPSNLRRQQGSLFSTDTDVVFVGVERTWPTAVSGFAVFAQRPPVAPHRLQWSAAGNQVTLSWTAPRLTPSQYVLQVTTDASYPSPLLTLPIESAATSFTTTAPPETFHVRLRDEGATATSNEVVVSVGCQGPPGPPTGLAVERAGTRLTFSWRPPVFGDPTGYVLEAGATAGATDIARLPLAEGVTTFSANAPPGTYHVRVGSLDACGTSTPSSEVSVTVGTPEPLPGAPERPTALVGVSTSPAGWPVSISWPPVAGATAYVVEVGSAPLLSDVLRTVVPTSGIAATAARGVYYVRIRGLNAAGTGPPSADVLVPLGY